MKHEKNDTITTLFVEPADERATVISWLVQLRGQQTPIVVILPPDAVFRRPGDLRELQQAIVSGNLHLILVIEGNERLRLWARHQGFTVFSATETCFKALSQWGKPAPSVRRSNVGTKPHHRSAVSGQLFMDWDTSSPEVVRSGNDTQGEMYRPSETAIAALTVDDSRKAAGYFAPGEYYRTPSRDTEPLEKLVRLERARIASQQSTFNVSFAPFDAKFLSDIYLEASPLPNPEVRPANIRRSSSFSVHVSALWRDRAVLLLIGLVMLGAVGGVGLGYFLK